MCSHSSSESSFSQLLDEFVSERVVDLVSAGEKTAAYRKERESIQDLIDKAEKVMTRIEVDELVVAARGIDIPLYEYVYRAGVEDGIRIMLMVEQANARR